MSDTELNSEEMPVAETSAPEVELVPEDVKEHEAMLDVHMPHATHTWKDFLIHIGTITVGLLIAISLEQTVEKLHELHQRNELETALRNEGEVNKVLAEIEFAALDDNMTWLLELHEDIGQMEATGGKANLPYRQQHFRTQLIDGHRVTNTLGTLQTVVWDTASADGRLALLPDDMARAYSGLYSGEGVRFHDLQIAIREALSRKHGFEDRFADVRTPVTPVLARMNPVELAQYDALVMQSFEAVHMAKVWLKPLYGRNEALLQGLFDSDSQERAQAEAARKYPDEWGKIADEIAVEDAARAKAADKR